MLVPAAIVRAVARAYRALCECGRIEVAEELVEAFDTHRMVQVSAPLPELDLDSALSMSEDVRQPPPGLSRKDYQAWWAREKRRQASTQTSTPRRQNVDSCRHVSTKGSPDLSKGEERERRSEFRAFSASLENSEKSARSETRALASTDVDKTSTAASTNVDSRRRHNVDTSSPNARAVWRLIFDEWVKVVHSGKRAGDPARHRKDFESVAKDAEARSPTDPVAYAVSVMRPYVALKLEKGQTPEPRWFAADFATFADSKPKNGNGHSKTPDQLEYQRLGAERRAAVKAGDEKLAKECERKLVAIQERWDNARRL